MTRCFNCATSLASPTVGQRTLMDQTARAAIVQDIGDLGLLLARAQQDGDQALMCGREQDQRKLDAVAEQDRDAVTGLQP